MARDWDYFDFPKIKLPSASKVAAYFLITLIVLIVFLAITA